MITLTDALEAGTDLDAARELIKTISERMLAQTLQLVANAPDFTAAELEILREAKDSRNYVAHQGADFESIYDINAEVLREYIARLRVHVKVLALGDNVVSKWCYQFCEREPAPMGIQEQYVSLVLAWVFPDHPKGIRPRLLNEK